MEIIVSNYKDKYKKRHEKYMFIYFICLVMFFTITTLILLFSDRNYLINMIINIILTIIFGFCSIYFLTITNKNIKEKINFFNKIDNANINKYYLKIDKTNDNIDENGINIYTYICKSLDNKEIKLKSFEKLTFDENIIYYVETKLDYIITLKEKDYESSS